MKTQYISLGPLLVFALLVMLIEAASSAAPATKPVLVHTIDLGQITITNGGPSDEDSF